MPDIECIRPIGRRKYISIQKHHYTSQNAIASKWISRIIEYRTFDAADYGNLDGAQGNLPSWEDNSGNLWGILRDKPQLGTNGEQIGYFEAPVNANENFHGFPIFPFAHGFKGLPIEIMEKWVEIGILSLDDISKIIKKKKI